MSKKSRFAIQKALKGIGGDPKSVRKLRSGDLLIETNQSHKLNRLPEPISSSAATPDNSLNTSTSSLSTETCPVPTTFNKFAALSTEVHPSVHPLPESAATTSNNEPSKIPQCKTELKKIEENALKYKNQK
ncbi:hypothetical protein TNCV_4806821 [Trichonephila clavipes]|nr:hypothetical protein TNCV_4806821 [Trichonephila clavipes]